MKTYTHAPRALVTTETTRANILSALETLDLYTEEGKLIPTHRLNASMNSTARVISICATP